MFEFLRANQLELMLVLACICGMLSFFVYITKAFSKKRRIILICLELTAMLLLISDRYSYIYRGNTSELGFWMVRICNFAVFFFSVFILFIFNAYVIDLCMNEGGLKQCPLRLKLCNIFIICAIILLIASQYTNFYYSFDAYNCYKREKGIYLSYLFPLIVVLLEISIIVQYFKRFRPLISCSLIIFAVLPLLATVIQIFVYGISFTNITCVGTAIAVYILGLLDLNETVEKSKQRDIEFLKEQQRISRAMFEQTATALANAIDAKDEYTHGHSIRVAEYSQKIAMLSGKSEEFCWQVYFAGLLHDVGKIGVPISIINKEGKLTDEEFAEIKKHPVIGKQILSSIVSSPYLSIGANYHHERYDGHGYPEHLKGDDIPEIARIIAVADAYDAMTSKRSYRDPIPQHKVREEIVKGMGYQFDPAFAKRMLHLIDSDTEYQLKEHTQVVNLSGKERFSCFEKDSDFSESLFVAPQITRFKIRCKVQEGFVPKDALFKMVVFDSLDGRAHFNDAQTVEMNYCEFARIDFDGKAEKKEARKVHANIIKNESAWNGKDWSDDYSEGIDFDGEVVKWNDHVLIKINCKYQTAIVTIALPDNSRFAYICLTGAHCIFSNLNIIHTDESIDENYIPRIAPEVSYIEGPEGDIPNIQVDGWRTTFSEAIPVDDGMEISFHTKSFPTARLIWHCPFVTLFYSDDKIPGGKNFKEYVCIRIDGENWEDNNYAENSIIINRGEEFTGWADWKEMNKKGFDCTVKFRRTGDRITVLTKNCGISIRSETIIKEMPPQIYAVLTGDQCVITNIRIK
ncbi:HD-GYP domain-containing protein [Treponema sp.]|uniref:HD-GYP domain-containing protein n=1 Tax=Treponema sp. TaxID=166 RepID=UPI00298D770F|nr:HD-GYP domain-containing protein [Treponema sp.]MCR5612329.1 HD-GYP domain-containing protein [Treponema sp.]